MKTNARQNLQQRRRRNKRLMLSTILHRHRITEVGTCWELGFSFFGNRLHRHGARRLKAAARFGGVTVLF